MTEHDLQNLIRVELSKYGTPFRINVGKFKTSYGRWFDVGVPKGFSDILFIKDGGEACFIEVKVKPNVVSKEQKHFIDKMQANGCKAGVAYSVEDALQICEVY